MNPERDSLQSIRSTIDDVTGLYNRRMLYDRLRAEIARSRRFKFSCSCAILEVRGLAAFDERLGPAVGDHVLKQLSGILRSTTRLYDGLFRHATDQLAIVLPQAQKSEARSVVDRICRIVESHDFVTGEESLDVTIAIGIATFPQDAPDSELLLHAAESALVVLKPRSDRVDGETSWSDSQGRQGP